MNIVTVTSKLPSWTTTTNGRVNRFPMEPTTRRSRAWSSRPDRLRQHEEDPAVSSKSKRNQPPDYRWLHFAHVGVRCAAMHAPGSFTVGPPRLSIAFSFTGGFRVPSVHSPRVNAGTARRSCGDGGGFVEDRSSHTVGHRVDQLEVCTWHKTYCYRL